MHPALAACVAMLGSFALVAQSALAQTPAPSAQPTRPAAVYESDPKYLSAIKDAKEAIRKRDYSFVAGDYKKANKAAGGTLRRMPAAGLPVADEYRGV